MVLFVNEMDFFMRIVLGIVGGLKGNLEFVEDVKFYLYYNKVIWSFIGIFCIGGYIKIVNKGKLSFVFVDDDFYEVDVRVIEFVLFFIYGVFVKINI